MTLTVVNGPVIEKDGSLSDGVDVSLGQIVRITGPAEWTGTNITFQISSDGEGYNDLHDTEGNEITSACGPGWAIVLNEQAWWKAVGFLKIRSGSLSNPVPQADRREFAIAVWTEEGETPLTQQQQQRRGPGRPRKDEARE